MRPFKFFQKNKTIDSYVHYHIRENVPLDIVERGEIGTYQQGIDAGVYGEDRNCPYSDELRMEIWNRGFYYGNYSNTIR